MRIRKFLDPFKSVVALFALVLVKGHESPMFLDTTGRARDLHGWPYIDWLDSRGMARVASIWKAAGGIWWLALRTPAFSALGIPCGDWLNAKC
jgi:hypothetical protein